MNPALPLGTALGSLARVAGPLGGAAIAAGLGAAALHEAKAWTATGTCFSELKGPDQLGQRWFTCTTCGEVVCVVCADGHERAGHAVDRKPSLLPKKATCSTYVNKRRAGSTSAADGGRPRTAEEIQGNTELPSNVRVWVANNVSTYEADLRKSEPREPTPVTHPHLFQWTMAEGKKVAEKLGTTELWEADKMHNNHFEVYLNMRCFKSGTRDRAVWLDGRLKAKW